MLPEAFRRQLLQEAQRWRRDNLISDVQFQQLSDRYEFDRLDAHAKNRFTLILLTIGCILIGLGILTFVAANWQDIPRIARVVLLFGLFLGVNVAGFRLWHPTGNSSELRESNRAQHRLGEALLLLGSLTLGANLMLMTQLFHIGGSSDALFLTWGSGVLSLAYGLRLASLGAFAILLVGVGYWIGWSDTFAGGNSSIWDVVLPQMPIVSAILFIPLAYLCRSKTLFTLSAIAVSSSLISSLSATLTRGSVLPWILLALPAALLWAYDDTIWSIFRRNSDPDLRPFQLIARRLAVLYLGGLFYWLSFHWGWTADRSSFWYFSAIAQWKSLPSVVALVGVAIVQWIYLLRFARNRTGRFRINVNTMMIGLFVVTTAIVNFWHIRIAPIPTVATFIFNLILALLGIGAIRSSLAIGNRRNFWFGIVLVIIQIFSRLLEYETNLLLKSLIFVLCGLGVIVAGLWFERYVRRFAPIVRE